MVYAWQALAAHRYKLLLCLLRGQNVEVQGLMLVYKYDVVPHLSFLLMMV